MLALDRFLIDQDQGLALPTEYSFWDFLMDSSKRWGLHTYEQDWLYVQNRQIQILQSATLGEDWLVQMGKAAEAHGIRIQVKIGRRIMP